MNEKTGAKRKPIVQKRFVSRLVSLLNIFLLVFAALSYLHYAAVYQQRLREENLSNIANLNQASALSATTIISSWSIKLDDIAGYAESHNATLPETLAVIEQTNSSEKRHFELIGSDYTGYLARRDESGGFVPLSYGKGNYLELQKAFDDTADEAYEDVCFAPEFTDSATALKYFAIYRHIPIANEAGEKEIYTLLLATRSSEVLEIFNRQSDFPSQSAVLVDAKGRYIVSSNDFKSDNFFQYLYVYNDLSLDERNALESEFAKNGSGEFYFKNAAGEDCVFRYERMTTNDWYCVTCVPLDEFRTPVFTAKFGIYAVIALLMLLIIDVTWLRQVNRSLLVSARREKEASVAKTDFLSRMSHDIRTPLNGIIGLTTLALDEEASPQVREYLDNIRVSGQFLSGLVNDILDLSKVESGKVELNTEPYSGEELCRYVEAVVTPLCSDKGIAFSCTPPDDMGPMLLDRLRFNQIIFNLLSNAVKYTPAGGRVDFDWHRQALPAGRVLLEISVRDNGIGMSEEFQKHMFESFTQERSQNATTGSGLGLAIVKSLVSLMGGSISVKSRPGEGSAFTVQLETALCEKREQEAPQTVSTTLEGRRVLLCEDNKINIMVAQKMLEKWGMSVDVAVNGRLGVELFEASPPGGYDLILMDIMMPVMDGIEAAKAIRGLDRPDAKSVPMIAMTANAYSTDVKNCLEAGMDAHIGKPVDQDELQGLLSRVLGGAH